VCSRLEQLFRRGISIAAAVVTSVLLVQAFTAEQAVPVVFKERPAIDQVSAKALAKELLTPKQFVCFARLAGRESAWNADAKNPSSSARGVGQLLDSTYKNLGMKHSDAPVAQTVAALAYIGRRYGSAGPCGAWAHWQEKHWY